MVSDPARQISFNPVVSRMAHGIPANQKLAHLLAGADDYLHHSVTATALLPAILTVHGQYGLAAASYTA